MERSELKAMAVIGGITGLFMAAAQVATPPGWIFVTSYLYWLVRVSMHAGVFISILYLVNFLFPHETRLLPKIAGAIALSFLPFVLTITSLDIVLGIPELGTDPQELAKGGLYWEFGKEMIYLLDNHIFLCTLVSSPCWLPRLVGMIPKREANALEAGNHAGAVGGVLLDRLDPPFTDHLLRVEAQEHYVHLIGKAETRMILYRFNDIVRDLPEDKGMRVHRSHWVAYDAVSRMFFEGANLRLMLHDGVVIPVSRRFAPEVKDRFTEEMAVSHKAADQPPPASRASGGTA